MSNIKTIYVWDVKNEVEVDKTETKTEGEGADAKTITVTTKVKELRPTWFAIKKPNKAEREECDIVRDVAFRYFVDRGVITEGNLRKQYGDSGGVYTNEEEKIYSELHEQLRKLVAEYQSLSVLPADEEKAKSEVVFDQIFTVRRHLINFEKTASIFYERTAEAKAQKKAIEHYIVQLTHTREDSPVDKPIEWKPFFKGVTVEEKLKHLGELEDDGDLTYLRIRDRVILVCLALAGNHAITPEQIDEQVNELE